MFRYTSIIPTRRHGPYQLRRLLCGAGHTARHRAACVSLLHCHHVPQGAETVHCIGCYERNAACVCIAPSYSVWRLHIRLSQFSPVHDPRLFIVLKTLYSLHFYSFHLCPPCGPQFPRDEHDRISTRCLFQYICGTVGLRQTRIRLRCVVFRLYMLCRSCVCGVSVAACLCVDHIGTRDSCAILLPL